MTPNPPPEYANHPNLWRVARELSKCKEPYKALGLLLTLAEPMLKEDDHDE